MKLTNQDKELLLSWGYPEEDFGQIEKATKAINTKYEMTKNEVSKKVSQKEAIEILGREEYLSGVARSAFHWSSCRDGINGELVHFDSSNLFKY